MDPNQRYRTNYGWSLIKDTPENRDRPINALQAKRLREQASELYDFLNAKVEKLG